VRLWAVITLQAHYCRDRSVKVGHEINIVSRRQQSWKRHSGEDWRSSLNEDLCFQYQIDHRLRRRCQGYQERKRRKEDSIYIAPLSMHAYSQSAQAWITQFSCKQHHACLSFVSVHQMAPPQLRHQTSNASLLLIYRLRKDERLSWPGWLTYSGWFTNISGHSSATGRVQDKDSSPVKDRRYTVLPRDQLYFVLDGQGSICEILTGGSEFGTRTDQTVKGTSCPSGRVLRRL